MAFCVYSANAVFGLSSGCLRIVFVPPSDVESLATAIDRKLTK